MSTTFFVFVVLGVGAIVFACRCIPETRGRTLEELEHEFTSATGTAQR